MKKAMRELYERYPDDFEGQTFYALARLAVGYATPNDTSLSNQLAAAQILEKTVDQKSESSRRRPLSSFTVYDYPRRSPSVDWRPLRPMAPIAPWVPHALHMPSHIFTRLGMWDDSIAANSLIGRRPRAPIAASRHRDAD